MTLQGIFNVTLNDRELSPWNVTGFRFNSVKPITSRSNFEASSTQETEILTSGPQILVGHFNATDPLRDTYLSTANWGKGVAFVNDHNLGRYWPLMGPQQTLYVPAPYLKKGRNTLVLVELEYVPSNRKINFQIVPVLDY